VIPFFKYEGAGNDFVIIDDRQKSFDETDVHLVQRMCDRHFGIGADGLMLLRLIEGYDFEMVYFNSDGRPSSMCGNGGRCLVAFAHRLGLIGSETRFVAVDGSHQASWISDSEVSLEMIDVKQIEVISPKELLMDTGSPHYVIWSENIDQIDLIAAAREIRYSPRFEKEGVNVNFIEKTAEGIKIRTYERGVEDETLACGTGVTAAAIAANFWGIAQNSVKVSAVGGNLSVNFEVEGLSFRHVWKTGPVKEVFQGNFLP
jgi:diaminopimelate epimerase